MRSADLGGPEQRTGLLIVNADDWGGFKEGTDAIEACFAVGAISSSTAMVHMSDTRRAAELAQEHKRPIGLHLNLTQPFDGPDVAPVVRERQRRLCAHFARLSVRRWTFSGNPAIHRLVADGIRDQLEEFQRLYGAEPTHVDSHHHVHVCPDVFLSRALAHVDRVRQTLSPLPAAHGAATLPRRLKHRLLARRFTTTSYFWGARELTGSDGSIPIVDAIRLARTETVEIMAHPSFPGEYGVLHSERWLEAIGAARLGPYSLL
jgi:chitin disaccharide deacetylase